MISFGDVGKSKDFRLAGGLFRNQALYVKLTLTSEILKLLPIYNLKIWLYSAPQ